MKVEGNRSASAVERRRKRRGLLLLTCAVVGAAISTPVAFAQSESGGGGLNIVRDTEIEEILHKDADPILRAAALNPDVVQIHLIGEKEINAFVAGGQHLFVYSGLIQETESPNQLIGVMAHETGHMAGGHIARSGDMQRQGITTMLFTMGLGLLAALAGAPGAGAALFGNANYFATLNVLGYSREQEARADQAGVTYLTAAHESAHGLVSFFNNFRFQEVFSESHRYPFFQDHPVSSDRIELLSRRASESPYYNVTDGAEAVAEHEIMKAKLDGFIDPPQETLNKYKEDDHSFPARYARAIAYYRASETTTALRLLDGLLNDYPTNPYIWEVKGQALFEAGRPREAEAAHRRSVELKPEAPLLRVNLAQAILAQEDGKRAGEAVVELKHALIKDGQNPFVWELMAQAYDAESDGGQARLATAEEHYWLGDFGQARVFALRALPLLKHDTPDWRRANDIVLTSSTPGDEMKTIAGASSVR